MGRLGAGEGLGIAQRVGEKSGAREPPGNPHKQEHLDPEGKNPCIPLQRQNQWQFRGRNMRKWVKQAKKKINPQPFK